MKGLDASSATVTTDIQMAVKESRENERVSASCAGLLRRPITRADYGRDKLLRGVGLHRRRNDVTEGSRITGDTEPGALVDPSGIVEAMPLQSKTGIAERLVHHITAALKR